MSPFSHNPHSPFWAGEANPGVPEEGWMVFMGAAEDGFLSNEPPFTQTQAEYWARALNYRYALRHPEPDNNGRCRVCHDYHGEPPWAED